MRVFVITLALLLSACAPKQNSQVECRQVYVILPDNFVIDLAAGSTVTLDPAMQEFALFCNQEEALTALETVAPKLPGGWRIYTLKEEFSEIGKRRGQEEYILIKPAQLADWQAN